MVILILEKKKEGSNLSGEMKELDDVPPPACLADGDSTEVITMAIVAKGGLKEGASGRVVKVGDLVDIKQSGLEDRCMPSEIGKSRAILLVMVTGWVASTKVGDIVAGKAESAGLLKTRAPKTLARKAAINLTITSLVIHVPSHTVYCADTCIDTDDL